jgi:hypothetical protein
LGKTAAALVAVAVLALAAGALVVRDEALTPEAAAMLAEPRRSLADEDNAWFMLAGLTARPEEDPIAFGREWTAAALEVRTPQRTEEFEQRFVARRIAVPTVAGGPQSPHLGTLLKRYAALHDYKGLQEPALKSIHSPLPYGPEYGYTWAKERTVEAALGSGDFRAALRTLWQDTDLQRRMLAGSSYFVSKAVFTVALARNYLAVSAIIRASPAHAMQEAGALRELLSPLSADELGTAAPAASQVRLVAAEAREQAFPRSLVARPNAAANAAARSVASDFAEIILRMEDVEALRRLVSFQLEAAASKALPPLAEPLRQDAGQIYFEPKSQRFRELGRDGRIAVAVPLV